MENVNRFLDAFSIIEQCCKEITKEDRYTKFYILIQKAAAMNSVVRTYQQEIEEYADLRNAIIHQRTKKGEVIAIPVDEAVEEIEKIARMLSNPPLLKDYFLKEVKDCSKEDDIDDVYKAMKKLSTGKFPITKDGRFEGLLTLEMILEWAMLHRENQSGKVKEAFKPQKNEKVVFMAKNATVLEALDCFEATMKKGFTLLAILITENGRKDEKLEGILTVADYPKCIQLVD